MQYTHYSKHDNFLLYTRDQYSVLIICITFINSNIVVINNHSVQFNEGYVEVKLYIKYKMN